MPDGSTRAIAEYRFARDEGNTRFMQWQTETPEISALPELKLKLGGRVMDLHQALIRDAESIGYNSYQQGALRAALDAYLGAVPSENGSGSGFWLSLNGALERIKVAMNRIAKCSTETKSVDQRANHQC